MRRARLVPVAAACAAVGVLVLPGVAEAHDPIIVDDSQTTPDAGPLLPDGTISFALYGVVDGEGDTRGFRAVLAEGDRLVVTLLAPDLPPEQAMTPDELPVLRIDGPDGSSRELEPDERVAFDEPFSGTRYLRLVEVDEPASPCRSARSSSSARRSRVSSTEKPASPACRRGTTRHPLRRP
jgi:hypothetical protein